MQLQTRIDTFISCDTFPEINDYVTGKISKYEFLDIISTLSDLDLAVCSEPRSETYMLYLQRALYYKHSHNYKNHTDLLTAVVNKANSINQSKPKLQDDLHLAKFLIHTPDVDGCNAYVFRDYLNANLANAKKIEEVISEDNISLSEEKEENINCNMTSRLNSVYHWFFPPQKTPESTGGDTAPLMENSPNA